MNGISLFSSAGIGEYFLKDIGINIVLSNELIKRRAEIYSIIHPKSETLVGDINNIEIQKKINSSIKLNDVKFLLATPPCQGFSLIGKNKSTDQMNNDHRNYLFYNVLEIIKKNDLDYILIENVPRSLSLFIPYKNTAMGVEQILVKEIGNRYNIKCDIFDCSNFDVAQSRKRAIIRVFKKGLSWDNPKKSTKKYTVRDVIGHLPSIESGQKSGVKWHFGRKHSKEHIVCMKNTPEGKSAFENLIHYPKKTDGTRPKGFKTTYARIKWDEPCPTITVRNDAISSQTNVHPGNKLKDGTYSDSRVLSIKELFLLTGLGEKFDLPESTPEILIRQVIGECVPPLLIKKICQEII